MSHRPPECLLFFCRGQLSWQQYKGTHSDRYLNMNLFTAGESSFPLDNLKVFGKAIPDLATSIGLMIHDKDSQSTSIHQRTPYPSTLREEFFAPRILTHIRQLVPKRKIVPQDSPPALLIWIVCPCCLWWRPRPYRVQVFSQSMHLI